MTLRRIALVLLLTLVGCEGPSDDADTGSRALSTEEVQQLVEDFVAAWTKVMMLDRFEVDPDVRAGTQVAAARK